MNENSDRYAVAVKMIVGLSPRKMTSVHCHWGGSTITCMLIEHRRCSADLPQGGVEVPCSVLFSYT